MQIVSTLNKKSETGSYDNDIFVVGPEKFCHYMHAKENDDYGGACAIPPKTVCPWPKQKYACNGFRANGGTFNEFSSGEYMLEQRYSRNDEVLNSFQFFFTIIKDE